MLVKFVDPIIAGTGSVTSEGSTLILDFGRSSTNIIRDLSTIASYIQDQAIISLHPVHAAGSALNRDVPGLRRKGHDAIPKGVVAKDEFSSTYKSRIDSAAGGVLTQGEIDWIRDMTQEEFVLGDVAKVEQRWLGSWVQSLKASCVFMPYIVALLLELMVPIQ